MDFCKNIAVIPQFSGTCWFNSILTGLLYSKEARKVMIKYSKNWDKKDKFFKILRIILKKNYKIKENTFIQKYFNTIKPEIILFKMLSKFDITLKKNFNEVLQNNFSNFGFKPNYILYMLKYFNINFLHVVHIKENNTYKTLFDLYEYSNMYIYDKRFREKFNNNYYNKNKHNIKKNIQNKLDKNPDILVLFHSDLIRTNFYNSIYNATKNDDFNAKTYNLDCSNFNNYNDIIEFNGCIYKLDSCFIKNYNDNLAGHSIIGITCNKNRYIYNGWTSESVDPANNDDKNKIKFNIPCSLMKFDWDVKKDIKFCLKPNCKINYLPDNSKKYHCFSFNRTDERLLIYVKISNKSTGSITSLSNYSIDKEDVKNVIKDIYIDNLNEKNMELFIKKLKLKNIDKKHFIKDLYKIFDVNDNKIDKLNIYKSYKHLKNFQGKLLKQQVFLSTFIKDNYKSINRFLLFHGIGTGKTCTSITICETIMEYHKHMKILVLLPARLKTNFIDELISANCGNYKYISQKDLELYNNNYTPIAIKNNIRTKFLLKIQENYDIKSYESIRNILLKSNDIKKTIYKLTKDRIIIIDEIHNLITSKLDPSIIEQNIKANKIISKSGGINAIILRLLSLLADTSCKIFYLTATPVFDNYGQFIELILNLCPNIKYINKGVVLSDLPFLLNEIKGKVSFYKLKDLSDLPIVKYDNILIPLSNTQAKYISYIRKDKVKEEDDKSNSFCIIERQLCISVFNKKKKDEIFHNMNEYAPKILKLYELLHLNGKHLIYSNFIEYCLELIALYLESKGWTNYLKSNSSNKYKTFVIWDATLNDDKKQLVKNIINSIDNLDGSIIKVILGSPSIKEGISFKHIQHLHQIDPVWNSSAKEQIEGRCIRFKSHHDIPLNHNILKREVIIHNYISSVPIKDIYELELTCDEKIYNYIIPKKKQIIKNIEDLLKKVSIDYYLWTAKYSPKSNTNSTISIERQQRELAKILHEKIIQKKEKKIKNNCPKIRRPISNKCIRTHPYIKINKQGFKCCYKKN